MSDTKTIIDKLDKLDSRVDSIDVTLAQQHVTLVEHTRRSTLLEEAFRPVQKHVMYVEGVLKFIGLLSVLAGIYSTFK